LVDSDLKKVIILGAGLVGALNCLMFKRNNYEVYTFHKEKESGLDRTYALTPNVVEWLKTFNLSKNFLNSLNPVKSIDIYKEPHGNQIIFDSNKHYLPALAYIVKEKNLLNEIKPKLSVQTIHSQKLEGGEKISNTEQSVNFSFPKGEITAPLLLACDGARSPVREQELIKKKVKDFDQTAIVFDFEISGAQPNKATQFFCGDSILAILPVGPKNMSAVWSCDNKLFENKFKLDEKSFKKELVKVLGKDFGKISSISTRNSFPLHMIKVQRLFKKRVLLMGDAAHSIHPLSGQGLNLGIRGIMELEKNIQKKDYTDIGLSGFLRRYERSRKIDIEEFSILTSGLQWAFSLKGLGPNYIISKGMSLINEVDFIKNKLIERAIL